MRLLPLFSVLALPDPPTYYVRGAQKWVGYKASEKWGGV